MGVTTRIGDRGWTRLMFGRRVRKDDARMEAIGTLDELNSSLGLARSALRKKRAKRIILEIQHDLIVLSSEIAAWPLDVRRIEKRVEAAMVDRLEEEIQNLETTRENSERGFVIPGQNRRSALLDISRAVARRAERRVVALRRNRSVPAHVLKYMNRLSDLLYLLARAEEKSPKRRRTRT